MGKDFFVGYLAKMPVELRGFVRKVVVGLFVVSAGLGLGVVLSQLGFDDSRFEIGTVREFRGVYHSSPYPSLVVDGTSIVFLVNPGKFSAEGLEEFVEHEILIQGKLLSRDGRRMVEIVPGSAVSLGVFGDGLSFDVAKTGGDEISLFGEVIDSKCFLGAMNPGNFKAHRACAVLCLKGGIPGLFVTRGGDGLGYYVIFPGESGRISDVLLDRVAEPLRIGGTVWEWGDLRVLEGVSIL